MSLIKFRAAPHFLLLLVIVGVLFMNLSIPLGVNGVPAHGDSQDAEITFKSMGAGSGKTEDGSDYSFAWVETSDGVIISARTERRRSAAKARMILGKTLRGAEIVERSTKKNNRGQKVGHRVVARLSPQDQSKARYVIVWTDLSDFHYLESLSLRHLREYEKMYLNE